jgi:type I restriction enzyme S subunit
VSWPVVRLGEVFDISSSKRVHQKDWREKGVPFYRAREVVLLARDGVVDNDLFIDEEMYEDYKLKYGAPQEDDILVTAVGTLGQTYAVKKDDRFYFKDASVILLRKKIEVDIPYILHALNSVNVQRVIKKSDGATVGTYTISRAKDTEIPLPPLKEQKRIAAILDKADNLRRKRKQSIQLADEFLRSVFLDMFGDIPAKKSRYSFVGCRGSVSSASGKSSKEVLSEKPTDIPVYGGNGINGYAKEALYDEPVIVVGRVGQQCAITKITDGPSWVTDNAIVVKVTDRDMYNPVYLAHAFMHSPIRDAVTQLDLPFINQPMLLDCPIPLPPIELQNKFERIRERTLMTNSRLLVSDGVVGGCFSALSQKAFSGQL